VLAACVRRRVALGANPGGKVAQASQLEQLAQVGPRAQ